MKELLVRNIAKLRGRIDLAASLAVGHQCLGGSHAATKLPCAIMRNP